jgi:zinc/manganese transport system ATP-binding protein
LLLARERIAHGPTALVLSPDNLQRARLMAERWDEHAPWCGSDLSAQVAQQAQLPV